MDIVRQESQSAHLCPRGHVASICIRAFKGRRDVLVHLFRPDWAAKEESYPWPELVRQEPANESGAGRGDSRIVVLESFTREEMDLIVAYLSTRYADRLTRISVNSLEFPVPAGLLPLSSMPEGKDIGRIRFEIVPRYPLPFSVHGLYDLSQHKPMAPGPSQA